MYVRLDGDELMRKPISKRKLLALIQQYAAVDAVGPSAVRGQPRKTVERIRGYLGKMNLNRMPQGTREDFARWLDLHTGRIQRRLPNSKKPWGIARKTLNLFLRTCLYNHYLRKEYGFARVGRWLEVPLDSVVARELRRDAGRGVLPRWRGLEWLDQQDSEKFQEHAREYASACKLPITVFLDNYLWLHGRLK